MSGSRIYVIGAGFAGQAIAREIREKGVIGRVVAFLDDDPAKIGTRLEGVPVLGPIDQVVQPLAIRRHAAQPASLRLLLQ